ncbi:hypothetical protein PVK06_006097 [Gossypium arboreum]|uniref:Uncharacterized protein n=1 Tax=Gossypium arboreum TaxID=29729 RepID=A0ABR0QWD8_GOSAR|nr:hypothetical protein PVK06_006097 [Gossypium arboreum]
MQLEQIIACMSMHLVQILASISMTNARIVARSCGFENSPNFCTKKSDSSFNSNGVEGIGFYLKHDVVSWSETFDFNKIKPTGRKDRFGMTFPSNGVNQSSTASPAYL